jgi:hypothetical protein
MSGEIVVVTDCGKNTEEGNHDHDGQQCPAQPGRFHIFIVTPNTASKAGVAST